MTTKVTIQAHVPPEKEVLVRLSEADDLCEEFTLQDGKTAERVVYEEFEITVKEVLKQPA